MYTYYVIVCVLKQRKVWKKRNNIGQTKANQKEVVYINIEFTLISMLMNAS